MFTACLQSEAENSKNSQVNDEKPVKMREVKEIEILSYPDKLDYILGEELDLKGLQIEKLYNDNSKEPLDKLEIEIIGFDSTIAKENQKVIIKYNSFEASFDVNIKKPEPDDANSNESDNSSGGENEVKDPGNGSDTEDEMLEEEPKENEDTSYTGEKEDSNGDDNSATEENESEKEPDEKDNDTDEDEIKDSEEKPEDETKDESNNVDEVYFKLKYEFQNVVPFLGSNNYKITLLDLDEGIKKIRVPNIKGEDPFCQAIIANHSNPTEIEIKNGENNLEFNIYIDDEILILQFLSEGGIILIQEEVKLEN